MGEDVLRVEEELGSHPRRAGEKRKRDRDELHRETERLLLDLRERLQERDENADHRPPQSG